MFGRRNNEEQIGPRFSSSDLELKYNNALDAGAVVTVTRAGPIIRLLGKIDIINFDDPRSDAPFNGRYNLSAMEMGIFSGAKLDE